MIFAVARVCQSHFETYTKLIRKKFSRAQKLSLPKSSTKNISCQIFLTFKNNA